MIGLKIFFLLSGYSFACISFGLLIFRGLQIRKFSRDLPIVSPGTIFATAFLLGQGVLANLWMLLSLYGWFSPIVVKLIILIAAISGLFFFPKHLIGLWHQIKRIYFETRSDSWAWQGIAVLSLLFCLAGVTSLGAPLLEDAANYYMTQPKVVAAVYHYVLLPGKESYYSGGFQGEMNNAVFMSLGSPVAAKLFSWPTTLAGAALLLALCSQAGIKRRGQWIALAMFVTSSLINILLGKGKIDLFPIAMGLGAFYWSTHRGSLSFRLIGLLSGFSVLGKLVYAVTLLPVLVIMLIWHQFQKNSQIQGPKKFLLGFIGDAVKIGIWGVITVFPLIIYNLVLFNNPVQVTDLSQAFSGWGGLASYVPAHIYVTYPLYITYGRIRHGQLGNLSVLVLMFIPMIVLIPRPKSWKNSLLAVITFSALFSMLIYVINYPTIIAPRYFGSCLFLFIPIAAGVSEYVTSDEFHQKGLSFIVLCSLFIVLISTFMENTQGGYYDSFFIARSIYYLKGEIPNCGLEEGAFTASRCKALTIVNKKADPGDRVLTNVAHNYFFRPDLLLCANNDYFTNYIFPSDKTWKPNWEMIFQRGYRFIVVDKFYNTVPDINGHPQWVNPIIIYQDNDLIAYRLDYLNPPLRKMTICQKNQSNIWVIK